MKINLKVVYRGPSLSLHLPKKLTDQTGIVAGDILQIQILKRYKTTLEEET